MAISIVELAVGEKMDGSPLPSETAKPKNAAAVTLGRLGGVKGGRARAEKLDAGKRSQIASAGANAKWSAKRTAE